MRLLELVVGHDTRRDAVEAIRDFADTALGKTVIDCKDTPGFIANRIGTYWLQSAVVAAIEQGVTVEEADAVMGRPMGVPKTGVFGLLDMVGLDLMPHVLTSLAEALPPDDPFHAIYRAPEMVEEMIAAGYTGRKGKGGFYRLDSSSGKRVKQARDLATGEYRDATRPKLDSVAAAKKGGLRALVEHGDKGGRYGWRVLAGTLSYAAHLATEIADDVSAIDAAMRLGYNWKFGPFELIDKLGAAWFRRKLEADGLPVPSLLVTAGRQHFLPARGRQATVPYLRGHLSRRTARSGGAPAGGRQTNHQAGREERCRQPLGHRRRRALSRVPQQDERARPADTRYGLQGRSSWCRAATRRW